MPSGILCVRRRLDAYRQPEPFPDFGEFCAANLIFPGQLDAQFASIAQLYIHVEIIGAHLLESFHSTRVILTMNGPLAVAIVVIPRLSTATATIWTCRIAAILEG